MTDSISRRTFMQTAAAAVAGVAMASVLPPRLQAEEAAKPRLRKALKFTAIKPGSSVQEKFEIIKSFGFEGVEMDSPSGVNIPEAVAARDKTGVKIHGVIDSIHWQTRVSDPDADVRAKGLAALEQGIRDAKAYGADTILLVPGRVDPKHDETFEKVWERSHAEIRKAIPTAQENGVRIAIEVVWNNFITKPEQLVKYVDEFQSPWVGAYMDMSNMVKFGVPSADWVRALGKRMLKFDFKGYSKAKGWVGIGDGDEDWPDVLKALDEVGYVERVGWATAEVPADTVEQIKDISARMDRILNLRS